MRSVIEVKNLTKKYGRKKALDNVSFNIESGKIIGLLGPNGSGKTTFIKIAAGMLQPTSGSVTINGLKVGPETKAIVSYMPDREFLYNWMKVKDAVNFFTDFFKDFDEARAYEMLKYMKLEPEMRVKALSKGMVERLDISLVMSRRAKLYLLDEPLAVVDPSTRDKLIDAMLNNFSEDSTILLSTHLVRDVERIFDEVIFISEGNILLQEEVERLRSERGKSVEDVFKEVFQ
jgi:ABC-2 type transport system ATP-binding protein